MHLVVPWKAVVTLNSTSFMPLFRLSFFSWSEVSRIVFLYLFSSSGLLGVTSDDVDASFSSLLARSTSILSSESSCVCVISDGFLTSSDLPNQPNHDFFESTFTSFVPESFSFLLSAFWQPTVSSFSRSEGRFDLNRRRLKENGY